MAKKGKAKAEIPAVDQAKDVPDIRPGMRMYLAAAAKLAWSWVKSHRLRTVLMLLASAAAVTALVVLARPKPAQPTNSDIVIRVSRDLGIHGDGNPAVLTVEDKSKATQPFLEQAVNGDKVLLYYKAKKAVLFRPSEMRIIHHGAYTPPDAKVFVRKGTGSDERVEEVLNQLEDVEDIAIASRDNSPKSDYQGVILVSITDRYDDKLRELEELFGVKVSRLPSGESFPDADILLIVGR